MDRTGLGTRQRPAEPETWRRGFPWQEQGPDRTLGHVPQQRGRAKSKGAFPPGSKTPEIRDKTVCGKKFPRKILSRNVDVVSVVWAPQCPPQEGCTGGHGAVGA